MFVMRGFFLTVPWQLQEAASLDGANSWQTFWRIMMPMAPPVTSATFPENSESILDFPSGRR
jgi:ABC-type glycerol-3-phosphate transport system permease component